MADQPSALSEPWYRAIAVDRYVQGSLPAEQWTAVIRVVESGARHVGEARQKAGFFKRNFNKSALPAEVPRAWTFEVAPLLRVLAEDAKPGAPIELRADLRGPKVPAKIASSGRLPGQGRVKKIEQTVYLDKWLTVAARFDDGTRAEIEVTDRVRHRVVHKKSASGKHKTKHKEKWLRRIDIEVGGQSDEHELIVPTPPPRVPVYSKPGASRPTVTTRLDHPLPPPGDDGVHLILKGLAEAHRHLHPRSRGAA